MYLLECGVKVPEDVERHLANVLPCGNTSDICTEHLNIFNDKAEDYEKAIATSKGLNTIRRLSHLIRKLLRQMVC